MSHHLSWAGQSKWHLCAAQPVPPQPCCTATNVLECSKWGSLQVYACPLQQKEDKLPMVCSMRGICPSATSQSNCKTEPWTPWESGAKPSVHWLGTDKEQSSATTTLLGIPAWHRAALRTGWQLCPSSYCIPHSPAGPVLPGGTAGAICSGDKHTGDCSLKETVCFMNWLCSITRV